MKQTRWQTKLLHFLIAAVLLAAIVIAGTPETLHMPEEVEGCPNYSETITVTVLDVNDNPVDGVTVNFDSSDDNIATITSSAVTDNSGKAYPTVAFVDDGSATLTGTVSGTEITDTTLALVGEFVGLEC